MTQTQTPHRPPGHQTPRQAALAWLRRNRQLAIACAAALLSVLLAWRFINGKAAILLGMGSIMAIAIWQFRLRTAPPAANPPPNRRQPRVTRPTPRNAAPPAPPPPPELPHRGKITIWTCLGFVAMIGIVYLAWHFIGHGLGVVIAIIYLALLGIRLARPVQPNVKPLPLSVPVFFPKRPNIDAIRAGGRHYITRSWLMLLPGTPAGWLLLSMPILATLWMEGLLNNAASRPMGAWADAVRGYTLWAWGIYIVGALLLFRLVIARYYYGTVDKDTIDIYKGWWRIHHDSIARRQIQDISSRSPNPLLRWLGIDYGNFDFDTAGRKPNLPLNKMSFAEAVVLIYRELGINKPATNPDILRELRINNNLLGLTAFQAGASQADVLFLMEGGNLADLWAGPDTVPMEPPFDAG